MKSITPVNGSVGNALVLFAAVMIKPREVKAIDAGGSYQPMPALLYAPGQSTLDGCRFLPLLGLMPTDSLEHVVVEAVMMESGPPYRPASRVGR
jgi:hypothetical protein